MPRAAVAVGVLAAVVYVNSLGNGFVFDDLHAVAGNPDVRAPGLQLLQHDFWGMPMASADSHKSFRPLCVLSFALDWQLWRGAAVGFHATNVVLHAIAAVLVYSVARMLCPGAPRAATVAGLLFAVHPIHTENVSNVVGRADILATSK